MPIHLHCSCLVLIDKVQIYVGVNCCFQLCAKKLDAIYSLLLQEHSIAVVKIEKSCR